MEGWIKLHRRIKEHWLWRSGRRFQWWIDILLTVNHADSKVLLRGRIVECKRGQSVRSLETWAKDWNVTKGAVRDFLRLLERDSMITIKTTLNTTLITVCNYEDYQGQLNEIKTKNKRSVNAQETANIPKQECKEEIKNEKNILSFDFVSPEYNEIFNTWIEYKKARKEMYRTQISLMACYNKLLTLSNNSPERAKEIVNNTMANNWAGLYALKTQSKQSTEDFEKEVWSKMKYGNKE